MARCSTCHVQQLQDETSGLLGTLNGEAQAAAAPVYHFDADGRMVIVGPALLRASQLRFRGVAAAVHGRAQLLLAGSAHASVPLAAAGAARPSTHPGHYVAGPVLARVLDDLERHGRVRYAYLGVVPGRMVASEKQRGLKLEAVLEDSPAEKVGLKTGDVLISVDGHPCRDPGTLGRLLVQRRPGERVELKVTRLEKAASVTLGDLGQARQAQAKPADAGVEVVSLDTSLRAFLGLSPGVVGVVVREVVAGSVAHQAGLRRGDVIVEGGGGPIRDVSELEAVLATAIKVVKFSVIRNKTVRVVVNMSLPASERQRAR